MNTAIISFQIWLAALLIISPHPDDARILMTIAAIGAAVAMSWMGYLKGKQP